MALSAAHEWACAQQVKNELLTLIQGSKPTYVEIEHLIHNLRTACEQTIFLDFEFASNECVGNYLWHAHTLINNRYRKFLGRYKGDKKLAVEKRKVEKHYVDFIKTSQFFYKGYIQRLASHFSGIKGLLRVARSLCLSRLSADPPSIVSPDIQKLIEESCYASLLHLGDLSRYRNILRTKEQSWDPAMGYYQLANDLNPKSGMAHNKMAVIALAETNHLNAVYQLHRALSASEPDSLAPKNLEIEFKKILSANFTAKNDSSATLIWWFVLLHANFNEGVDFSTYEELQNEVLSRLALRLKEESCGDILEKFVLISIAAQSYSYQRLQDQESQKSPKAIKTFTYHVSFNVRMMFQLLSILQPELDDHAADETQTPGKDEKPSATHVKISAIASRVLPALRHYTLWLASSNVHIGPSNGDSIWQMHNKQLWNMYAIVLTRLVNYFHVQDMITVPYLLEEDEMTVGFMPFRNPELVQAFDLYTQSNHQLKPYIGELGTKRSHPNIEMQSRILDIVCCGIQLQMKEDIPLKLYNGSGCPVFTFVEDGLPLAESSSQAKRSSSSKPTQVNPNSEYMVIDSAASSHEVVPDVSVSASDSPDSVEISMNRMVDSLLEPLSNEHSASCETSYGMHSSTANEIFAPSLANALDQRYQSTPKMIPSLPGLYSSAFTPQPNELQPISPNRPSTARRFSPQSLPTNNDRLASTAATDGMTGYIYISDPPSVNYSGLMSFSASRYVDPKQPYNMPVSSGFTNKSSIYMNSTPLDPTRSHVVDLPARDNVAVYAGASDSDHFTSSQSPHQGQQSIISRYYVPSSHGGQGG